jgi:predicted transglutaminase-like cysteine proteinase
MRRFSPAPILLSLMLVSSPAEANPEPSVRSPEKVSQFMRVYGPTLPPFGYIRFCERNPKDCRRGPFEESRFVATPDRMIELDTINRHVNKVIEPATDLEIYGETEVWTIPTTRGDCEDYVLLKRQMLMARGWPASALLITVVRDEKGEGHAVLTARTAQGDFILDNKTDVLLPWSKTASYTYVMRQSYIDPNVWVSLDAKDSQSPALMAGMRAPR